MAEAILNSVIHDQVQNAEDIYIYDINKERVNFLSARYGMVGAKSVQECVDGAEIVVVAVKPQNIDSLAATITGPINGMVLSIVAGCPIAVLKEKFRTDMVMRTMPNTPSMIAEGMTVWTTSPETPAHLRAKGEKLLGSIGEQVEVAEEKYLDMATAISGSGPAVSPYILCIAKHVFSLRSFLMYCVLCGVTVCLVFSLALSRRIFNDATRFYLH